MNPNEKQQESSSGEEAVSSLNNQSLSKDEFEEEATKTAIDTSKGRAGIFSRKSSAK
jgi:hypothetical protein